MFNRRVPLLDREEARGALLLLMSIADNVERIREEIVDDDEDHEEEGDGERG